MQTLDQLGYLEGRRVLVRVDFNVPLDHGEVADDARIRAALPTIAALRERGACIVLVSHLGRPKDHEPALSLRPVADRLGTLLGLPVQMAPAIVGAEVRELTERMSPGSVLMLENVRYEPGETVNDPRFSRALAELADVYVNDAFGTAHRAHASTEGVTHLLPEHAAGLLMEREVKSLTEMLSSPARPFAALLGGAKVADKIAVIDRFRELADLVLIGGAMCFPFLRALGHTVGASRCSGEDVELANRILSAGESDRARVVLPQDLVIADRLADEVVVTPLAGVDIPPGMLGLDIGPATVVAYRDEIDRAATVFWNGPMGAFEHPPFAAGTRAIGEALAAARGTTIVGGGDTVAAVREWGLDQSIDFVSTGGGAALELIEGRPLPGVEALA